MKDLNKLFIFAAGAAIGSVAAWFIAKTKYEKLAKEEIASVKEVYALKDKARRDEHIEKLEKLQRWTKTVEENVTAAAKDKPDILTYAQVVGDLNYTDYSEASAKIEQEKNDNFDKKYNEIIENMEEDSKMIEDMDGPYVIPPEEFDEMFGYETVSLTYFADGIYEDEFGEVLDQDDIIDTVGLDAVNHFGEYEDDSVFVRNDEKRTDYEILRDNQRYYDLHRLSESEND